MPPACAPRAAAELEAFNPPGAGAGDRAFRGAHARRAAVAPVSVRGDIGVGGVGKALDHGDGRAGRGERRLHRILPFSGMWASFPPGPFSSFLVKLHFFLLNYKCHLIFSSFFIFLMNPDPDNSVPDDHGKTDKGKLLSATSEFILAVLDKE